MISLFSEDGWVTNLGSSKVYNAFYNVIVQRQDLHQLYKLVTLGQNSNISIAAEQLYQILSTLSNTDVKSVGEALSKGLEKIRDKEIAIISQEV